MPEISLTVYWMAVFGLTLAITKLHVFEHFRGLVSGISDYRFYDEARIPERDFEWTWRNAKIGRLVRCPACMGFWVGLLLAVPYWVGAGLDFCPWTWWAPVYWILMALSASAFCIVAWMILKKLGFGDK